MKSESLRRVKGESFQKWQSRAFKIVESAAKKNGSFGVDWRYRNDSIRRVCELLEKRGVLKKVRNAPGADLYKYIKKDCG